jgi:hypothetical protein
MMGGGSEGVKGNNGRGLMNQSKVYSQWGYIKRPL